MTWVTCTAGFVFSAPPEAFPQLQHLVYVRPRLAHGLPPSVQWLGLKVGNSHDATRCQAAAMRCLAASICARFKWRSILQGLLAGLLPACRHSSASWHMLPV
jgi:hypothetical protein